MATVNAYCIMRESRLIEGVTADDCGLIHIQSCWASQASASAALARIIAAKADRHAMSRYPARNHWIEEHSVPEEHLSDALYALSTPEFV